MRRGARAPHTARGGAPPSCSLCTNELSINENGKHLFCEHKRFSWINYCTTATKWKQKVWHRSCVAHFPLANCYQRPASSAANHGKGGGVRKGSNFFFTAATYFLWRPCATRVKFDESSKQHLVTATLGKKNGSLLYFPLFFSFVFLKKGGITWNWSAPQLFNNNTTSTLRRPPPTLHFFPSSCRTMLRPPRYHSFSQVPMSTCETARIARRVFWQARLQSKQMESVISTQLSFSVQTRSAKWWNQLNFWAHWRVGSDSRSGLFLFCLFCFGRQLCQKENFEIQQWSNFSTFFRIASCP